MYNVFILLGGNMGNRLLNLQTAIKHIEALCGKVLQQSSIYQTAAWGYTNQPHFFNQAIQVQTTIEPIKLMQTLLQIEENMGRIRTIKMGPRVIDIDILLIDTLVIQNPILTVPHPALTERKFALLPLAEIAPNQLHATTNKTIYTLLQDCTDTLDVQKISPLL